jgi:hypothetical protein
MGKFSAESGCVLGTPMSRHVLHSVIFSFCLFVV